MGLMVHIFRFFLDEIKKKNDQTVLEMTDMFLGLGLINEAQAVLLEELVLKDMGFDAKGYIDLKKETNPYCKALEKGNDDMLRCIEDWHYPWNYSTSFMKTFLKFFGKIRVDKFTTQWEK